jgi:hypothetical protein
MPITQKTTITQLESLAVQRIFLSRVTLHLGAIVIAKVADLSFGEEEKKELRAKR